MKQCHQATRVLKKSFSAKNNIVRVLAHVFLRIENI